MTADNFTEAARIIDAHRENERWVGDGVKIECVCGHTSHATYDFSGPITEDKNNHRDAERMHAAHVAQVLAAQEPTDGEVLAALNAQGVVVSPKMYPAPSLDYWGDKPAEAMRAALSAARRDEEKR